MVGKITGNQLSSTIIISGSFSGSFVGDGSGLSGTGGGSTPTFQQVTDAGASTTTAITASIISASGDIVGNNLSGTNTGDQDLSNLVTNAQTASFAVTGSDVLFGNITSSGNISASGDVIGNRLIGSSVNVTTGSITHITDINEIRKDADTFIRFEDNKITLNSFGNTANSILEIGSLASEESFVVKADSIKFQSYGANPIITIAQGTNSTRFHQDITASSDVKISGDITAVTNISASGNISTSSDIFAHSGSFSYITASIIDVDGDTIRFGGEPFTKANIQTLKLGRSLKPPRAGRSKPDVVGDDGIFEGHITSSGNISASGDIVANNLSGTNTGDQDLSNLVTNSSTASFAITGSGVIFGSITSSGNISASNTVFGVTGSFNQISSNPASIKTNITMGSSNIDIGNTSTAASLGGSSFPFTKIAGSTNFQGMVAATNFLVGSGSLGEALGGIPVNSTLRIGGVGTGFLGTTFTVGVDITGNVTASGGISASGDIVANKVTADVVDTSFETFLNFEAATAFTFIAPFPLTINFTGSSTASMGPAGFVTASANTSTFSIQQTPPITLNIFDKLKVTPSASGLFSFSGSRTI